eukprot:CAMPEP_0185277852 /NCGR_PEP_ID=MMETSP1359-20130426/59613_1 /TAXON_ID=552665 /ORGANISM="Bigelowiella longifila, Strain CCMP242" /LENGTH=751 /DNA_ID=CAMNT_0027872129 /DNA_START=122 /DNA_END=2377 /DNA_ORIENTATION=-
MTEITEETRNSETKDESVFSTNKSVFSSNSSPIDDPFPFVALKDRKLFWFTIAIITSALAIFMIASAATMNGAFFQLSNRFPKFYSRPDRPTSSKELFNDISKEVIPDLEDFFYDDSEVSSKLARVGSKPIYIENATRINCTSTVYGWYLDRLNTTITNPLIMEKALSLTGLENNQAVLETMKMYLSEPQNVSFMFEKSQHCAARNDLVAKTACALLENQDLHPTIYDGMEDTYLLGLHVGVVMEVLTSESLKNNALWKEIFTQIVRIEWDSSLNNLDSAAPEFRDFFERKINSIFQAMQRFLNLREFNYDPREFVLLIWLNILEAAHEDWRRKIFGDNVIAAMVLNFNVNDLFSFEDSTVKWPLTKEWVDLYISWNLAYVGRFQRINTYHTLLIPSVVCSESSEKSEDFILARSISLGLNLLVRFATNKEATYTWSAQTNDVPVKLMQFQGQTNIDSTSLSASDISDRRWEEIFGSLLPERTQTEWKLTNTAPLSYFDDAGFNCYVSFTVSFTMILTGLGMEIHIGPEIVNYLKQDRNGLWFWILAQFLFAFFSTVAILSLSPFGLPFLVLGLWKFGFPETIAYLRDALDASDKKHYKRIIADAFNSLGLVLHHSSSVYVVVNLSLGFFTLTRDLSSVLLILVIQHWFVPMKYFNATMFTVIELLLEIWWQWEFFSNFEHFVRDRDIYYDAFAPAAAACMLFSHWLFLAAAALELLESRRESQEQYFVGLDAYLVRKANKKLRRISSTTK